MVASGAKDQDGVQWWGTKEISNGRCKEWRGTSERQMAFASDASVNKSGGAEMIGGAKKQVVAGKHRVVELGYL